LIRHNALDYVSLYKADGCEVYEQIYNPTWKESDPPHPCLRHMQPEY